MKLLKSIVLTLFAAAIFALAARAQTNTPPHWQIRQAHPTTNVLSGTWIIRTNVLVLSTNYCRAGTMTISNYNGAPFSFTLLDLDGHALLPTQTFTGTIYSVPLRVERTGLVLNSSADGNQTITITYP